MKRQMFEVLVNPNIKKFGCNFVRTKVSEYKPGENHPIKTDICDNNPIAIRQCLINALMHLDDVSKKLPESFVNRNDKVIVFHRDIGDKKEMFVTLQDHKIGNPIDWLD